MPDSRQLRILKKMTAHLIDTPGYAPLKIVRGQGMISSLEAIDILSILEAPRPIPGDAVGQAGVVRNESWTLLIQGWPLDDKQNPSDPAYAMKAAIEARLAEVIIEPSNGAIRKDALYRFGGDIISMTIGQGVVRPPTKDETASRLAMFYLPVVIELVTDVSNPYA